MAAVRTACELCWSKSGGVASAPSQICNRELSILQWGDTEAEVVGTQVGAWDMCQEIAFIS